MINKSNIYFPLNKPTGGSGAGEVQSVNGKTGTIVLLGSDISDDTLTTSQKNITSAINEINSNKETKTNISRDIASSYYNSSTSQYDVNLLINQEVYITSNITGVWNINFPVTASAGDISSVSATCDGTTAPTIVINSTFIEDDGIPSTADKVEIVGKYDGNNWVVLINKITEAVV